MWPYRLIEPRKIADLEIDNYLEKLCKIIVSSTVHFAKSVNCFVPIARPNHILYNVL